MSDIVERLSDEDLAKLTEQARANAITGTLMDDPLLSALSELARLRALTEWRFDMENAPRDGTPVIGYQATEGDHKGRMATVWRWDDGKPFWTCADYPGLQPTAWLPLSPPPKQEGLNAGPPSSEAASTPLPSPPVKT